MLKSIWTLACFLFCLPSWAQESPVSIGDQAYLNGDFPDGKVTYIKYPTLGCPTILQPGAGGYALIRIDDSGSTSDFQLSLQPTGEDTGETHALPVTTITYVAGQSTYKVAFTVPNSVPADMYDFRADIPSKGVSDLQYNSFRVVTEEAKDYTFVVIADPQVDDPRGFWYPGNLNPGAYNAYSIQDQMIKEVRALNPTFVLLVGDVVFGMDYDKEYEEMWNRFKNAGFAIFMVPGNHDGLATLEERTFLGLISPKRDGLDYWRKYFGPTYFSFAYGGTHFQGVNSFDGSAERRDSFLIVQENHGGDLTQEQMDWIEADLAGASGPVVPFLHHSPLGPYRENGEFVMSGWILARIFELIATGSVDEYLQTWNTEATAEFLKKKYEGLPLVFLGHEHEDREVLFGSTNYRFVTTCATGTQEDGYWGYAVVRVENSLITDHLYQGAGSRSVPIGNIYINHVKENEAEISSGLSRSYQVTLEFVVPSAPAYSSVNGEVVQVQELKSGFSRVWVHADLPLAESLDAPETLRVSVHPAEIAGTVEEGESKDSGGSCGAPSVRGAAEGHLVLMLLPLALLAAFRRRQKAPH